MPNDFLTETKARELVEKYVSREEPVNSTQSILDAGEIERLRGYRVKPGKVSDSIHGGEGSYIDEATGQREYYENPPLNDVYGRPLRLMVRTSRISTHDMNRGDIPFKDQILAMNHEFMRRLVIGALGTSQFEVGGLMNSSIIIAAENLEQIPLEHVLRAYMAESSTSTSLYQHYIRGKRKFCGHNLPEGLVPNGPLPYVMDTPSTKDEHDESVSPETLFRRGLVTREQYKQILNSSLFAFGIVSQFLYDKGLILVDTKTEHGVNSKEEIVSQDEIYTMDSSRFWRAKDYEAQLEAFKRGDIGEISPVSFSKEFARGIAKGEEGFTDDQRVEIAVRYIRGIQHLLGRKFVPDMSQKDHRVINGLEAAVQLATAA